MADSCCTWPWLAAFRTISFARLLRGIALRKVVVRVAGDFQGEPAVSTDIQYEVELSGQASAEELRALVDHVDRIAEIPNSLRGGTSVHLARASVVSVD
jgi:putative redox protein